MADTVIIYPGFIPIDDAEATKGKNGKPALAEVIKGQISRLNGINYAGRTLYAWWGGTSATNSANVLRQIWNHHHTPGTKIRGEALLVRPAASVTGASIRGTVNGAAVDYYTGDYDLSAETALSEPSGVDEASFFTGLTSTAGGRYAYEIGSMPANGPALISGLVYEAAQDTVDPASTFAYVPTDFVGPDLGIPATSGGTDTSNVNRMRLQFLHCWNRMRPTIGWSAAIPGTSYIDMTTSRAAYRYIFDQTIGDGGTAQSTTGPGLTFPLRYAANGRETTINLCVYVYAAMSGGTDTGTIGMSHKAAGGASMSAIAGAASGAVSISGTTFAWYPAVGASPMVFNVRADLSYERLVLCAKSSGATDSVRIGAVTIFPMVSTTIT